MSKVDWSLAPEGATHKETSCQNGFWYKFDFDSNQACFWGGKGWTNPISADNYNDGSMDTMEPRPPKPWSGPEDGLPPLGIEFEYSYGGFEWIRGEALYIGNIYAILKSIHGGEQHYYLGNMKFRAIKTEEQRASEKRETAIRELMDIAQVDCRVTAARLVDAGFKREVV